MSKKSPIKFSVTQKNWIYYNLLNHFKSDLFFKHLDPEGCLLNIKKLIFDANSFESLFNSLNTYEYKKTYSLYRKDGKRFIYPSMSLQIRSLVEVWPEILEAFTQRYPNFDEAEDHPEALLVVAETNPTTLRNTFGLLPNIKSLPSMNSLETIKDHILASKRYVKKDFKSEYQKFKNQVGVECRRLANKDKTGLFIQTDIKSFYHNIEISDLQYFLKKYYPQMKMGYKWLNEIEKSIPDQGLPIGWILSPFYVDLVMHAFQSEFKKTNSFQKYTLRSFSFVDDMIFIVEENSSEEFDKLEVEKSILKDATRVMHELLPSKKIQFHEPGSAKTKVFEMNSDFLKVVDTNWFDFAVDNYSEGEVKFGILNEFFLNADDEILLNENSHFFQILMNMKKRVEINQDVADEEFNDFFKKITLKIKLNGDRYLSSICDIVISYLKPMLQNDPDLFLDKLDYFSDQIIQSLSELNLNALRWVVFYKKFIKAYPKEFSSLLSVINLRFELVHELRDLDVLRNEDDRAYLDCFFKHVEASVGQFVESSTSKSEFALVKCLNEYSEFSRLFRERGAMLGSLTNEFFISHHFEKNKKYLPAYNTYFSILIKKGVPKKLLSQACDQAAYVFHDQITKENAEKFLGEFFNTSGKFIDSLKYVLENFEILSSFFSEPTHNRIANLGERHQKKFDVVFKLFQGNYVQFKHIAKLYLMLCLTRDSWFKVCFSQLSFFKQFSILDSTVAPLITNDLSFEVHIELSKYIYLKVVKLKVATAKNKYPIYLDEEKSDEIRYVKVGRIPGFKEVIKKSNIKVLLCPLHFEAEKNFTATNLFTYDENEKWSIDVRVRQSLEFARKEKADIVIFPEMCLPSENIWKYLKIAGSYGITIIGGISYITDSDKNAYNKTVISFPVNPKISSLGMPYTAFFQDKVFPSSEEYQALLNHGFSYRGGNKVFVFKSDFYQDFSVLTCSDFVSTHLKTILKKKVQSIFVPAINKDSSTYEHLSQACVRELYVYAIVCNNMKAGVSQVVAPFRESRIRNVFKLEGRVKPEFFLVEISPAALKSLQAFDCKILFKDDNSILVNGFKVKDYKQLPPDWNIY